MYKGQDRYCGGCDAHYQGGACPTCAPERLAQGDDAYYLVENDETGRTEVWSDDGVLIFDRDDRDLGEKVLNTMNRYNVRAFRVRAEREEEQS